MCGSALVITSPSISRIRRSTPCAAGCCGPKFMVKFWSSGILGGLLEGFLETWIFAYDARHQYPRFDAHRFVYHALLLRVVAHFHVAGQGEILTKRITYKAVVSEDTPQIRMAAEEDAVQVEGF